MPVSVSSGFEPHMDPIIATAAAVAAVPPLLFWIRVVIRERRRKQEIENKERARLELKRKLFGDK